MLLCDGWWCRAVSPGSLFLSSPPPAQSSDCFRHAQLWLASPSPCKKQETEGTPLPCDRVRNREETFPMLYWVVSGRSLWDWRTSLAPNQAAGLHCQLATQCGHPGLGNRASAETPKVLEVGKGESRTGTSRWGLSVKPEASGANCSAFSFDTGDDLCGNTWAQSKSAHLVSAQ